ncbi:MAG: bile acid:sodium symporter family protein [Paracoccus sp. (in: a-proteobacteria)]|uniref:bile acid:sodium symporter family protein n=1 Tax=Paracoccus sp. TaxID=267 RepID=UPI0039E395AD
MRRFLPDGFTLLLIATVVLASILPARGRFAEGFGIATDLAIALLFFLHGARLAPSAVRAGMLNWRLQGTILAVTFCVFPLIGLAVGLLPESLLPHPLYLGILYLCLLPSTVQSSIAFTSMAGGNVPASICAASVSNILGVFLTPLMVGLMLSAGSSSGVSLDAVQKIMLQLLLPFLLGQALQRWIGDWVRARKKLLMPVDRGSILMVVYLAFSHAVAEGIWHQFSWRDLAVVAVLDVLILVLVLALTTYGARFLGFPREDEISIVFCGSKKSLASGVPMANAIFPAAGVGAIVLPVMLFHQIQLMACAVIAQRYARRPSPVPS